jgi:hypothetical protein
MGMTGFIDAVEALFGVAVVAGRQFVGNFGDNMFPDEGPPDLTKHHLVSRARPAFRHDALEPSLISINQPEHQGPPRSLWTLGSAGAQHRPPHVGQHVADLGEQLPRLVEPASDFGVPHRLPMPIFLYSDVNEQAGDVGRDGMPLVHLPELRQSAHRLAGHVEGRGAAVVTRLAGASSGR